MKCRSLKLLNENILAPRKDNVGETTVLSRFHLVAQGENNAVRGDGNFINSKLDLNIALTIVIFKKFKKDQFFINKFLKR
jgi:hypothetical protein